MRKAAITLKRTKLRDRQLPNYTKAEEIGNTVTHISGGGLGILMALLCLHRAIPKATLWAILPAALYGVSLITVYCISSIYHGLRPGTGKKVLQVLDHCMIYLLIAGTYTPILVWGFIPVYPVLGWCLLAIEWILAALAITLTAIDLKKYRVFSMLCYIGLGWAIGPFLKQVYSILSPGGFWLLLAGGIAYTVGAVLFGLGKKIPWMHFVFHIFVILGSALQFLSIYLYLL